VSENLFEHSIQVAAPVELMARFFADGEAWFRLNPEWEVLAFANDENGQQLKVRYERSEQGAEYRRPASADFCITGGTIILDGVPPRMIELGLAPAGDRLTRLDWREAFATPLETERVAELNLWIDATAGYLAYAARTDLRGRLAHWVLDHIWLRMSPMSRRISLLIVGMEVLALLLFIAVLIVYRFLG
jgi:hypothetical protein